MPLDGPQATHSDDWGECPLSTHCGHFAYDTRGARVDRSAVDIGAPHLPDLLLRLLRWIVMWHAERLPLVAVSRKLLVPAMRDDDRPRFRVQAR
jgi:hypothetical protein